MVTLERVVAMGNDLARVSGLLADYRDATMAKLKRSAAEVAAKRAAAAAAAGLPAHGPPGDGGGITLTESLKGLDDASRTYLELAFAATTLVISVPSNLHRRNGPRPSLVSTAALPFISTSG